MPKPILINGTSEDKTAILRALGSKLTLFNKKIDLDAVKPFLEFKNNRWGSYIQCGNIELANSRYGCSPKQLFAASKRTIVGMWRLELTASSTP